MIPLPDKASALIRLALKDLEEVEKLPGFEVRMNVWLKNFIDAPCSVCFAGAVMVRSLFDVTSQDALPVQGASPGYFDYDTSCKLNALDAFRCGDVFEGLRTMGFLGSIQPWTIARYEEHAEGFKSDMRELAAYLETQGL